MLRAVAHPGVVELLDVEGRDPPDGLVLRMVRGGDMRALGEQPAAVIAGLGAALATIVADLHDLGLSHGAIDATHVLLDEEGRPVLCSFGRAERALHPGRAQHPEREDVRAVAVLLLQSLRTGGPVRLSRNLRRAARSDRSGRRHDARWLAHRLVSTEAGARLPDRTGDVRAETDDVRTPVRRPSTARPANTRRWPRRVSLISAGAALSLAAACVVALLLPGNGERPESAPNRPSGGAGTACPPVDEGCTPVAGSGGFLTTDAGRYQVGATGDVVVVGRWQCGSNALPALLRPATGDVWTFASWPTAAHPVVGRFVARISYATSLRVVPRASGCDRLEVERRGRPSVVLAGAAK